MSQSSVFHYDPIGFVVTSEMKQAYKENGYVLIRKLLSKDEISKVRSTVENSNILKKYTSGRKDEKDKQVRMCLWNHPGDDVLGTLVRMKRFAGTMEQLMDAGELYHYHSKLMQKDPNTGGSFLWHQDYGYWYYNGCLEPEMSSVFLPVDDCNMENGCLQVLRGSHKMGRIDHHRMGDQQEGNNERVEFAKKKYEHVQVEMAAGDALFFNCNLLHTSGENLSDKRRWVLVTAFNSKRNNPVVDHHHPRYKHLQQVDNSELMKCEKYEQEEGKWFMEQNIEEVDRYNLLKK